MTEAEKIAAVDADALRQNPIFQQAVLAARKRAVEALVTTDPTDAPAIMARQAEVRAIDSLCGELAAIILRGTPQRQSPVA